MISKEQEKWNKYISEGGYLGEVPEKFITQEMCNDYIENGGFIDNVPFKFTTQEMCNKYFERTENRNFDDIPEKYRTQEMYEKYLFASGFLGTEKDIRVRFNKIPVQFRNKKICDEYMQKGGTISRIPKELITQEMCETHIKNGGDLSRVPGEFITQEMCDIHIINGGSISSVPEKYRTQEMWDTWYKRNKDNQIIKDLLLGNLEFNTRKELEEKYNITSQRLNTILKGLEHIKPDVYEEIKNKFKNNSIKQYYGIQKDINTVMDIVKSLGEKPKTYKKAGTAYTKEQKIQFSYSLSKANINNNIFELYKLAIDGKLKFDCDDFIRFCRIDLGMKFADIEKGSLLDTEEFFLKTGNNWLKTFNEDYYLKDKHGNDIKHAYLDKNGNQVEIDKTNLDEILSYLTEHEIPTSNCIVTEAIRRYVQGDLDEFVSDLELGTYLKEENNIGSNNKKMI